MEACVLGCPFGADEAEGYGAFSCVCISIVCWRERDRVCVGGEDVPHPPSPQMVMAMGTGVGCGAACWSVDCVAMAVVESCRSMRCSFTCARADGIISELQLRNKSKPVVEQIRWTEDVISEPGRLSQSLPA